MWSELMPGVYVGAPVLTHDGAARVTAELMAALRLPATATIDDALAQVRQLQDVAAHYAAQLPRTPAVRS